MSLEQAFYLSEQLACVSGAMLWCSSGGFTWAPFFEVQTDVCECFCAIHWDPSHADCAVPQELETDQVLKQLKYVEVLRPRVAARRKKSDCTQNKD
ncbi:uncharacterized protein [Phaseolus vulgaris]|uniref:uncharacterized protein isoform X2 n=1 Tax=Phaseolus vulgaris TaxID=3885 RepID=UPI0035CB4A83